MAETVVLYRLKYENDSHFKLEQKVGDDPYIEIVSITENANIASIWEPIAKICNETFRLKIDAIGEVMKA